LDKKKFSMANIVKIDILQDIQDKFADATGLAAVIVDVEGVPITKPSNFTDFCKIIRASERGRKRCMLSDAHGGMKAKEVGGPYIYHCHSGLIDLAAPITVKGQFIGTILCGQVVLAEELKTRNVEEMITCRTRDLEVDTKKLMRCFKKIEVSPKNRAHAAAELLSIVANYIVEMGTANIFQRELIEEIKARRELEQLLRNAELKALQSQINPHFLFNTLNTIARLAFLENAPQTEEVAYALSDLLRYSLRNIEEIVPLEKELECVKKYLLIQKVRFEDRIKIRLDVEEEIMKTPIPLLTIQPIVENAIVHGLELKKRGGELRINGVLDENRVVIEVIDNGVGIPREKLINLLKKGKKTPESGHTTGLGLMNVNKRLQHYFGPEFGLSVDSQVGKGTTVKITVPFKRAVLESLKRHSIVW